MARILHSIYRRVQNKRPKDLTIGPYRIRLAKNSQLANFRAAYHLYDTALGKIAKVLHEKYSALRAIDIGANVGDTAALIRETAEIPVLCVEGDSQLHPLLQNNLKALGAGVDAELSFVGPEGATADLASAHDLGNNACLVESLSPDGAVKFLSLSSILDKHPKFRESKLLKIDTEGFDFKIISGSLGYIRRSKPAIFFEYDPHFHPEEPDAGLSALKELIDSGYSDFIYFDNFGNLLLHVKADNLAILEDLNKYLASNRKHGMAVFYFDICALHQEDAELVPAIKALTQSC